MAVSTPDQPSGHSRAPQPKPTQDIISNRNLAIGSLLVIAFIAYSNRQGSEVAAPAQLDGLQAVSAMKLTPTVLRPGVKLRSDPSLPMAGTVDNVIKEVPTGHVMVLREALEVSNDGKDWYAATLPGSTSPTGFNQRAEKTFYVDATDLAGQTDSSGQPLVSSLEGSSTLPADVNVTVGQNGLVQRSPAGTIYPDAGTSEELTLAQFQGVEQTQRATSQHSA
jgi:hypothetical protein